MICLRDIRLGLLARIDLPDPHPSGRVDGDDPVGDAVAALMPAIQAEHPDTAVLVGYEEHLGASHPALDAVAKRVRELGVHVRERLVVHAGRWWSLDCTDDPGCCPPAGTPLTGLVDAADAVAEFVGLEVCPHPDRASLVAQLEPGPLAEQVVQALLAISANPSRPAGDDQEEMVACWARILDHSDDPPPLTARDAARVSVSLVNVQLRDALIGWLTPGTLPMDLFEPNLQDLLGGPPTRLGRPPGQR